MAIDKGMRVEDWLRSNPDATMGDLAYELRSELRNENASGLDGSPLANTDFGRMADEFGKKLDNINKTLKSMDVELMRFLDGWKRVDKAASDYAKTIGATKQGLMELRSEAIIGVSNKNIGFDFNMDADELMKAQADYAKAIGRSVNIDHNSQRNLAAIRSIYGESSDLFDAFDKMGVTMDGVAEHAGKMFSTASKSGISLEKYANNVKQGIAMANTYTFRNGLKGMEAMAKRATAIRMDMAQVSAFADKFSNVEDAISNSARLQVLGGQFAQLADPINLLNMSLNSLEDTEKTMEQFTNGLATFNKQTGEVEVSTFNRLRLREFSNITGQDPAKVMEVARRQAMRGEIEAQMNNAKNVAGFDEEFRELIKNTASFKEGQAGVSIDGHFKKLADITEEDRKRLEAHAKTDSENIQDIAISVRSLDEIRKGIKKQYEAIKANASQPLGSSVKGITETVSGILSPITKTLMWGFVGGSAIGLGWKAAKGVSKLGGQVGGLFRAGTENAGEIIPGATKGASGFLGRFKDIFTKSTDDVMEKVATNSTKANKSLLDAIKGTKTVRKTRQVTRLVKAGKGAKVVSSGLKSVGKRIPIAGALLSMGIEAYQNREQFKDRQTRGTAVGKISGAGIGTAIGAGLGSLVGPLGTIVGGMVGEWVGKNVGGFVGGTITKIQNRNRDNAKAEAERNIKDKDAAIAVGNLKGDYSVKQMREIERALKTGELDKRKLSNAALRKLRESGDIDALEALEGKKTKRAKEKAEKKEEAKKKYESASFEIGTAYISSEKFTTGKGVSPRRGDNEEEKPTRGRALKNVGNVVGAATLGPVGAIIGGLTGAATSIIKGKKEKAEGRELAKEKPTATTTKGTAPTQEEKKPIEVNINGTLKLEYKGKDIDILDEMKKNPKFRNAITDLVIEEMNKRNYGAVVQDKHGTPSSPYAKN